MKALYTTLFFLFAATGFAQKSYFQQEVNYKIRVTLDDVQHSISGDIEFEYINHAPETLSEIWVHLWGNAFKNHRSAFCKQKLRDGDGKFYFAKETDLGRYKGLDFSADGQKIEWKFDPKNPDIAVLSLPKGIATGQSVRISTPIQLKIPASFSRLGHVETSYQMTQWYPKPAVYDAKGWHAMPYLDIGEFYSEFGAFDVSLTLPENYVVGATGVLQTASEIEFLNKKAAETRDMIGRKKFPFSDTFPPSSTQMKTIRYLANQVHDFAWFADKRFWVLKDTARLASGKTVDCWAMFPASKKSVNPNSQWQLWTKGAFYVRRAVEFYSTNVGEYPWPQATAVHSALSAGGGMEYPMITVIGNSGSAKDLDDVITHEVGHNWFYGILASNEREHPFMDEGVNSYYEHRYMRKFYGQYSPFELPKILLNEKEQGSVLENAYLILARGHQDTPPDTHSNLFTPLAYGLQVYMKTALCLFWLEQSTGTERFDAAMQDYYRNWKFKHPYPEDMAAVLREHKLDADWFFEAMQTQKQADFKLRKISKDDTSWNLTIENKGELPAPFPITAFKSGKALETRWFSTIPGKSTLRLPFALYAQDSVDAFEIDYMRTTLDINRKNNFRRSSGLFPGMRPLEYRSLAIFQNSRRNTIAVIPWLGWNNSDKTMVGIALYNPPLPPRKLQYYLLPGYATGSNKFVGLASIKYHLYTDGFFKKISLGVGGKTFDFKYNFGDDYYTRFYRIVPQVRAELRSRSMSFQHALNLRTIFLHREDDLRSNTGDFLGKTWRKNTIYELRYEGEQQKLPNPYYFQFALETQDYHNDFDRPASYLRGTFEWRQKLFYQNKKKVTARFFAGYFLKNTQRHSSVEENALSLNPQSFNDYRFDQTFISRTGSNNFLSRRVLQTEGWFKGAFGSAYGATVGNSNNYILALNLKADLPVRLPFGIPLKPYFDLGYFDDATPIGEGRLQEEQLLWSGGLMLEFFKGGLEVYFPLINSKTMKDLYCQQSGGTNSSAIFCGGDYRKMISYSLRVALFDPVKTVEDLAR